MHLHFENVLVMWWTGLLWVYKQIYNNQEVNLILPFKLYLNVIVGWSIALGQWVVFKCNMFYSVQQGSRYILSLTNQRSWFEVRRLQHHQQIKAHSQHMVNKIWLERGKKQWCYLVKGTEGESPQFVW